MRAVFWELPSFARLRESYLDDDAYKDMQNILMQNPDAGAVIPGTGGLRTLRYVDRSRQKGKRGGLRVIYFWKTSALQFWLFSIYDKDEASDLTAAQRKILHQRLQQELKARSSEL